MATTTDLTTTREGSRVLVVEDSRAIASLLVSSIDRIEGVTPVHAGTLQETRALLAEEADDIFVAVLDLNLPDAPRGEVVDAVQAYGIPVIILTGSLDPDKRQALFRRNIADYVSKRSLSGVDSVVRLVERIWVNREHVILVVDDSAAQRNYLRVLLHNHGYRTLEAADGQEGLDRLAEHPEIRLVITDYNMPRLNGLQMLEEIRRKRSADELAVIAISGVGEAGILPSFLKSGANDFLGKPFEIEELYCRIDQNLDMLRHVAQARDAANRDYLTRLYNRRYFFEHAEALHARALRGEIRLMVAMVDADHFKSINDTHGHRVGDEALKAIAGVLQTFSGRDGFPARFGGEEFVCIQMLAEDQHPGECLERLRAAMEAITLFTPEGKHVPITVSIGATCNPQGSIDQMLELADEAVYLAKAGGRNQVVVLDAPCGEVGNSQLLRRGAC